MVTTPSLGITSAAPARPSSSALVKAPVLPLRAFHAELRTSRACKHYRVSRACDLVDKLVIVATGILGTDTAEALPESQVSKKKSALPASCFSVWLISVSGTELLRVGRVTPATGFDPGIMRYIIILA